MNQEEKIALLNNCCEQKGWRKHCGIKLAKIEGDKITFSMLITEDLSNFHGIAQGGALTSLLDTVMGFTCIIRGRNVVTMNLNLNFIKGPKVGTMVYASADLTHIGRTSIIAEAECFDAEGVLYAKASGTFYILKDRNV